MRRQISLPAPTKFIRIYWYFLLTFRTSLAMHSMMLRVSIKQSHTRRDQVCHILPALTCNLRFFRFSSRPRFVNILMMALRHQARAPHCLLACSQLICQTWHWEQRLHVPSSTFVLPHTPPTRLVIFLHRLQQQHITHKFPVHKKSIHIHNKESQGELHNGSICSKFFDGVCSIKWVEFATKFPSFYCHIFLAQKIFKDFLADTKCESKAHFSSKRHEKVLGHWWSLSMHQSSHFAISFFTSSHDFQLARKC